MCIYDIYAHRPFSFSALDIIMCLVHVTPVRLFCKYSHGTHTHLGMIFAMPGRVAQSVGHLTRKSGVLGSIPGLATYFRFSFRFFKKGSCQLLAKVCAGSTG